MNGLADAADAAGSIRGCIAVAVARSSTSFLRFFGRYCYDADVEWSFCCILKTT